MRKIAAATLSALAGTLMGVSAHALTPPPPQADEDLLPLLYEELGGEDWDRNDGWLDPDVHWCDWYGVSCDEPFWPGFYDLEALDLPDNNLSGEMSEELAGLLSGSLGPEMRLDLAGNDISGSLQAIPALTEIVDLTGNRLSGPLPELDPDGLPDTGSGQPYTATRQLLLAGNHFEGKIPESWVVLELDHLDLSDNDLEAGVQAALSALGTEDPDLWLADNPLDEALQPDWFSDRELASINLCWTKVVIDDEDLDAWIDEHHLGGSHRACLDRQRMPMDISLSGSWYDPQRSGEGFTLMVLDDGTPLVYWFSHVFPGRQMWQFNSGVADEKTFGFRPMLRTRGSFEAGFDEEEPGRVRGGQWRLDRVGDERIHGEHLVAYTGYDLPSDIWITWPPIPDTAVRRDYHQLSRLAGTTCENRQPNENLSGAWYNPDLSGQGFILEVIEDGRGVVYWFSYTPESERDDTPVPDSRDWQAWMMGDGQFDGDTLIIENMIQPRDLDETMPLEADGIESVPFGSLVMQFDDDEGGHVWFDSNLEEYGSGDYAIKRLARPMLADCDH